MNTTTEIAIEENKEEPNDYLLKGMAHIFSFLFHPLFIPFYLAYFLIYVHPYLFVGFSAEQKIQTLFILGLNVLFFPLLSVLLLKRVGFIESLMLRTQKDRIIPYIACGIFFFWTYTVFKQQPRYPLALTAYLLGLFLASSVALLANIYIKVSMHAIGLGGWIGLFLYLMKSNSMLMTWPIALLLLITGLTCSFRLFLKSHRPIDIYVGLLIGLGCQLVALVVIL